MKDKFLEACYREEERLALRLMTIHKLKTVYKMEPKTPQEFLREKYKLVDFHDLTINGKSWLELMEEYRLLFDDNIRANYYEDKIDMLNRHLQQRDEELKNYEWLQSMYQKQINDLVNRLYPVRV